MNFQISNTPDGYVVEWYDGDHWHPLRNFGDRQSDAIEFKTTDCPRLDDWNLKALVKRYDPSVKYKRLKNGRMFVKQKGDDL